MKKLVSLVLAALMLLSLTSAFADGAPYINKTGEKQTLTVFRYMDSNSQDWISDWNETPFYQKYEELTGVHVEFVQPTSSAAQETLNMLMISGEMPDIIMSSNKYAAGNYQAYLDGYYTDLRPYLEKYAPEYWAVITSSDEIWRECVDSEGVISAFYRVLQEPNPAFMRLVLKQEMLDKLGIAAVPQTIADWEVLFQAMLEAGITPYALNKDGYEEKFMGAYDVMPDFYQVDGKITYGQVQEGFRQYLELMHSWYEKGYISKDFVSLSNIDTLFSTDEIGTYNKPIVAAFNFGAREGYTVRSTPYPRQTVDQKLHWDHYTNSLVKKDQDAGNIAVSTSCKNVELAVQWINFLYTEPGIELANWGVEGLNFEYVDGQPKFLPTMWDYKGISAEGLNYVLKGHNIATLAYADTTCHANLLKNEAAAAIRVEYGDDPLLDSAYYLPTISLTEDESEIKTSIMNDIDTYVDEMVLKFIIGTEPLSNWDAFVAQVNAMGLEKVIEVEQAGLDRYLFVVRP